MYYLERLVQTLGGHLPALNMGSLPWIVAGMAISALMCFMGYRLFRVFIALCGVGLGAVLGSVVGSFVDANDVVMIILIVMFVAGICLVSFLIYKVGVFLIAFFVFWSLSAMILDGFKLPIKPLYIALLIGLLMGILTVMFIKPMVIVSSGLGGGIALMASLFGSLLHLSGNAALIVMLLTGIFVGGVGMLVQFKVTGGRYRKKRK